MGSNIKNKISDDYIDQWEKCFFDGVINKHQQSSLDWLFANEYFCSGGEAKKYNIIYVDPPWSFKNNKSGKLNGLADHHYETMTIDDIKRLSINEIADENCVLIMWWVGSQPQEALDLVSAWGFKLKTMTGFNWVKMTKKWLFFFGMGFWTRAGSECCLIAVKGKAKPISHAVRSVVQERATKHSEKPAIFREKIVELCGDIPRIELFARKKADGWDSWGNEVEAIK